MANTPTTPLHIKRPPNSFMLWSTEHRSIFNKANPNISNSELSKILGNVWLKLSDECKYKYIIKSRMTKLDHELQYPDYKYQPNIQKKQKVQKVYKDKICKIKKQKKKQLNNILCNIKPTIIKPIIIDSIYKTVNTIFEEPDYFQELQVFYEQLSL